MITKGYKTSEFWVMLVAIALDALTGVAQGDGLAGHPGVKTAVIGGITILSAVYAVARSYVKASASAPVTPVA